MTKHEIMRVILIVGILLMSIGIILLGLIWATKENPSVIKIRLEGTEMYPLQFERLCLVPGEECEYTVLLEHDTATFCNIKFDFVDLEEQHVLKDHARVRIVAEDEVLWDELLAIAMEGEPLILPVDFKNNVNTELRVIYYLPIDVGNEAKNAEALFELQLTATNE